MLLSGLYSSFGWRNEAGDAERFSSAAQRYGWSVESGGSLYAAPGVTGSFGALATWLEEIKPQQSKIRLKTRNRKCWLLRLFVVASNSFMKMLVSK